MTEETSNFKVTDRQSFVIFLAQLRQDFLNNPETWVNKNLSDYLEALSMYAEDIQGYYDNTNQNVDANVASWETFSDIFKGATLQE